jgi:AsmA protein
MKILKWLIVGVVSLAALLLVAVVVALNFLDLNQYKDKIQEVAKQQTGRELAIPGDIGVSYFPWVGLTLGELAMGNPETFGDADFVRIGGAEVQVKLLPLLKKSVEVKTIKLSGLAVDLQRAADGTTNWQDLLAAAEETPSQTERQDSSAEPDASSPTLASLAVSGVEIADASIRWRDAQSGSDVTLAGFNLNTGAIAPGVPFNFSTDFALQSDSAGVSAKASGTGQVTLDLEQQRYQISQLQWQTDAQGEALPNGALSLAVGAAVLADLAAGQIDATALTLSALGIELNGDVTVSDVNSAPVVAANLRSEAFSPADVIAALGLAPVPTADETVLKRGQFSASLSANASAAELTDLQIGIDDTTLNGSVSLPDLSATLPPVRFDLNVDQIDLDRYLPAPQEDASPAASSSESVAQAPQEIELPLELLRDLDIDGVFNVGEMKVAKLAISDIALPLVAKDAVIAADGIAASLYGGAMQGKLGLNASNTKPEFTMNYLLKAVQAAPLLRDLLQDDAPISGEANFAIDLQTAGSAVQDMKAALAGEISADFTDGSLNGINIGYQLRRARSFLAGGDEPVEEAVVKTDFSALHLGATIANGIINSDDLDIRSPGLRIGGAGTVDLPQEQVDYTLKAKVVGSVEGQGGAELDELKGLSVGIPIRGSFSELAADFTGTIFSAMRDDFKNQAADNARALAEAEAEKVKAEARAKAEAAEQQAREKLEAEKARAEEKLAAELAKQQEKAKALEDELKEKAREKIKDLLK